MKDKISDNIRLVHILESIEEIEKAPNGHSFDTFFENNILRTAVTRWLEVIGEAAKYISDETKNKNKEIEWRKMVGMRNVMIHKYFDVDYMAIWKATIQLKYLKLKIISILPDENK